MLIIVQEAERIGDLSKSLAKAAELATAPRVGQSVHPLRRVRDRVQGLFPDVRLGFIQADARAARRVMEAHTSVKVEVADFLALIAEGEIADTNRAVVLAIAARMIGRVSSHLSNIASSVVLTIEQVLNAPTWDDTGALARLAGDCAVRYHAGITRTCGGFPPTALSAPCELDWVCLSCCSAALLRLQPRTPLPGSHRRRAM